MRMLPPQRRGKYLWIPLLPETQVLPPAGFGARTSETQELAAARAAIPTSGIQEAAPVSATPTPETQELAPVRGAPGGAIGPTDALTPEFPRQSAAPAAAS